MKDAETGNIGEIGDGDVIAEMLFDVVENSPQTPIVERMSGLNRQSDSSGVEMRMHQSCCKQ